jgi:hypothetical protein
MKLAVLMLGAMLCSCATKQELRMIDVKDAQRAVWAKPKTTFAPSEPLSPIFAVTADGKSQSNFGVSRTNSAAE